MKTFLKSTLIVTAYLFLTICSNNDGQKNSDEQSQEIPLQAGKIVENVKCRSNPVFSYRFYLPKSFDASKKYPLIIIFDAHARAKLALSKFINASENYGYIIAVSNEARNGIKDINPIVNALWDDIVNRLPIEQSRIYTAGFSGGARIAASVAIFKGGVKGVLACGAGMPMPEQKLNKKFDYISIVGLNDLNYQELLTLDKALTENGFVNEMLTFNGTHEWPDEKNISRAVAWFDLMAMKSKLIPINDKLVRDYTTLYADSINQLIMDGQNYEAYLFYNILLKDLEGLFDITDYKKSYQALVQNPQIEQRSSLNEKLKKEELDNQALILDWFKTANFSSLKNEAAKLQKLANTSKEDKLHQSKRLLGFMGMLSFLYTENSLNSQNKEKYQGYMEIYELLEPKNSDIPFFKACQAVMDKEPEKAITLLQKAIELGFYDANRLQTLGYFEELRMKPEFDILIAKATENLDKQK